MNIRHDKQDLLERLLNDNGETGLTLHIEYKVNGLPTSDFYHSLDEHQLSIYMTTVPENKLPKIFNSTEGTFLQGTMTFPKNGKMKKLVQPSSSSSSSSSKKSSSSSVSSGSKKQVNSPTTTNKEGTTNSPSSRKDRQYQHVL
ncbi:unnamed protein product [Rotaria sordida]|uniref:Uncharacterized protein n=1 Tax=Rotaria sordida TaxID=392033 RepID=A0A815IER2_9BILA|nr:unnamed protein product [Rotaria sordida]CAF1609555.1 unnamed protein product [Rotaria sordida]